MREGPQLRVDAYGVRGCTVMPTCKRAVATLVCTLLRRPHGPRFIAKNVQARGGGGKSQALDAVICPGRMRCGGIPEEGKASATRATRLSKPMYCRTRLTCLSP